MLPEKKFEIMLKIKKIMLYQLIYKVHPTGYFLFLVTIINVFIEKIRKTRVINASKNLKNSLPAFHVTIVLIAAINDTKNKLRTTIFRNLATYVE